MVGGGYAINAHHNKNLSGSNQGEGDSYDNKVNNQIVETCRRMIVNSQF